MTKKDFKVIAEALEYARYADEPWEAAVRAIAEVLARDNERFDYHRFYAACGMYRGENE